MIGRDSLVACMALGLMTGLAGCGGAPAPAATPAVAVPAGADVRVIFDKQGRRHATISGGKLAAIARAITEARR
jgi:hypothetical protein